MQLLQKQKDNEIVTLNARVNAWSAPVPQASTSTSSSSTGPASTSPISLLSKNSTPGAASSSTAPESSSQVLLSSTHTETTAPGTMPRVIRSPKVGTGHKAVKIVCNDVTLAISPFQTKEQTSGSSRCHARNVSKGVILQNLHTLRVSKTEAQRAD